MRRHTLTLALTPNPNSIYSAEHWSVKSSYFDGRSATHHHVPECVCHCLYILTSLGLTLPNNAESVLAMWRTMWHKIREFRSTWHHHQTRVWLSSVLWELDPGACAFSVDSVDWSTPVADMPSPGLLQMEGVTWHMNMCSGTSRDMMHPHAPVCWS